MLENAWEWKIRLKAKIAKIAKLWQEFLLSNPFGWVNFSKDRNDCELSKSFPQSK